MNRGRVTKRQLDRDTLGKRGSGIPSIPNDLVASTNPLLFSWLFESTCSFSVYYALSRPLRYLSLFLLFSFILLLPYLSLFLSHTVSLVALLSDEYRPPTLSDPLQTSRKLLMIHVFDLSRMN